MPSEAHHIGTNLLLGQGDGPRRLGSIENEERTILMGQRRHAGHVINVPCKVRGMRRNNVAHAAFGKKTLIGSKIKAAIRVYRSNSNRAAPFIAKLEQGTQHRVVRSGCGNQR